jgi:hypothetical protein
MSLENSNIIKIFTAILKGMFKLSFEALDWVHLEQSFFACFSMKKVNQHSILEKTLSQLGLFTKCFFQKLNSIFLSIISQLHKNPSSCLYKQKLQYLFWKKFMCYPGRKYSHLKIEIRSHITRLLKQTN